MPYSSTKLYTPKSLNRFLQQTVGVGVCSRQLEVPATSRAKSGTESRFPYPCDERKGVEYPSGWILGPLQGRQDNVDAIGVTGKPDIRVPKRMKREEGLHARGVLNKEDAGGDKKGDEVGNQEGEERPTPETPKTFSFKDTTMKGEAAEGREFHHVPRGTWLHQAVPETNYFNLITITSPVRFLEDNEDLGLSKS
ncbi:hypothetical protein NDU88_002245 [Pleurodeles waltl]|uniref:Uncharacterized protein n=1 Tax=Pleurodeles waltl TaxID=8319 RepID=A0AAV7LDM3_PLEWA|nr:hypothetical protein NDU88_002245 [Pleurodeles waltl]